MDCKRDYAGQRVTEEDSEKGIQTGITKEDRKFVAVRRRDGTKVPGVYLRGGVFYARFVDPSTGKRRWAASRDGTQAGAEEIVSKSKKEQRGARAERFSAAIEQSALRVPGATVADCLALYPEAAAARRRMMGGEPKEETVRTSLASARRIFAGHLDEKAADAGRLYEEYLATPEAKELSAVSVYAYRLQLSAIWTPWAIAFYRKRGLVLPDRVSWPEVKKPDYQFVPPPQELRERTIAEGKREIERRSEIGRAFLLEFFAAMSAADAVRARWDWLGEDGHVHFRRNKTGKPCDPPLDPWALAHWRAWAEEDRAAGRDGVVLSDSTERMREKFIGENFARWMRSLGWETKKKGHELRKLACSIWYSRVGGTWAARWIGDRLATVERYYGATLSEMAPPAPSMG